jgi:Cys-rich protein (TIGR01571 family)
VLRAGCFSCWCPCVAWGKLHRRYDHLSKHGTPHPTGGGSALSCLTLLYAALMPCTCCTIQVLSLLLCWFRGGSQPLQSGTRISIRRRYGIRGNCCRDQLISMCMPCDLTQQSRELQHEENREPVTVFPPTDPVIENCCCGRKVTVVYMKKTSHSGFTALQINFV